MYSIIQEKGYCNNTHIRIIWLSGPYIRLYEANGVSQKELCTIDLDHSPLVLDKKAFKNKGCPNDEARSMVYCNAKKGSVLWLCDNDKCKNDDEILKITAKDTMIGCQEVETFETSKDLGVLSLEYVIRHNKGCMKIGRNVKCANLDGKVSGIKYSASG